MKVKEILDDNESLILEIIEELDRVEYGEAVKEKLIKEYKFIRGGEVFDFYNRKLGELKVE